MNDHHETSLHISSNCSAMATKLTSSCSEAVCELCNGINIRALKESTGYVHHPSLKVLRNSANNCELCNLILEACIQFGDTQRIEMTEEIYQLGPIRLFATACEGSRTSIHWRYLEELQASRLSSKILVTVGELNERLSTIWDQSIQLEMYTLKGQFPQFRKAC